jgi:hypothetical protein
MFSHCGAQTEVLAFAANPPYIAVTPSKTATPEMPRLGEKGQVNQIADGAPRYKRLGPPMTSMAVRMSTERNQAGSAPV